MGYITHDAVIVVIDEMSGRALPDVGGFRESLPQQWQGLVVGPVDSVANAQLVYAFLPDGSKEGWPSSDRGDEYREQFVNLFNAYADVTTFRFGGDFGAEVGVRMERPNAREASEIVGRTVFNVERREDVFEPVRAHGWEVVAGGTLVFYEEVDGKRIPTVAYNPTQWLTVTEEA